MKITKELENKLIEEAKKVRSNAFALRSEHKIGSAVLTKDGEVFGGCNIEANISGLGICAERCAINHAINHKQYKFVALCLFDEISIIPCGACLQYLMEFRPLVRQDILIISATPNKVKKYFLSKLLPNAYISKKSKLKVQSYI